ncbi:YidC/Oxa1 family membrane protein insertase [Candidatus Woesebacteria bacterium]|nr:YidC/Oxa1 family membrane protein insertase [Candidatus Woesebacteria bacterium]
MLDKVTAGHGDMGIAVILLTIVVRLMLLPLSLAEEKSEGDRHEITQRLKEIEVEHASDPIAFGAAKREVIKTNKRVLIGELINLVIQVSVALMLWKIFSTGLKGADMHLLYGFMPNVHYPFNLVFMDKFDLTHPSLQLNLIQTALIFILETILMLGSTTEVSKKQFVRLQFILPIVSFFIFLGLPAGKKLFVITSLIISIILASIRTVKRRFAAYKARKEAESVQSTEEKVVVEVR